MNQTLAKNNQAIVKSLSNGGFVLAMILAAACWGAGTVMSKGVLEYLPPLTLLVIQLIASLAGLFLNLISIFTVGGAYLFLAERLAIVQWVGAALILVAVMAMLRFQNTAGISKTDRLQAENTAGVG